MSPWIGAIVVGLLLLSRKAGAATGSSGAGGSSGSRGYSYGGDTWRGERLPAHIDRDPRKLEPLLARKLEVVFRRMRMRGFDPILWEGLRSAARAKELKAKGVGIYPSKHMAGRAADIVDGKLRWGAPKAFWEALGEEAEREGLVWGGRFKRVDYPHVELG